LPLQIINLHAGEFKIIYNVYWDVSTLPGMENMLRDSLHSHSSIIKSVDR
jgi:hypothetical protein